MRFFKRLLAKAAAAAHAKKRSERGQASIMMAFMLLTFVFFFAFVVNTGMLVNAKINLQNAADMAAYAGAAVQARQLTHISYLNYEMRRQYKKFLFRYYVMGNMAMKGFPPSSNSTGTTPMVWSPNVGTPGEPPADYGAPLVCVTFNHDDNYCQRHDLRGIATPPYAPGDAIQEALRGVLQNIEAIRRNNCVAIGGGNTALLQNWLWNMDPDLTELIQNADPVVKPIYTVIRGLSRGIGLAPRLIFLLRRIKTLEYYVNQDPAKDLTYEGVRAMANSPAPAETERQIQAFLSAYYTLGDYAFNPADIKMDELLPKSGEILKLGEIKVKFDTYAKSYVYDAANNCVARAVPIQVANPIPVGIYKDPSYLTYYALRLKAKVSLIFSPFGDLQLKAYAAAQPFGSRLGPVLHESDFLRNKGINLPSDPSSGVSFLNFVPNLGVRMGDSALPGHGWDTLEVLGAMRQGFSDQNGFIPQPIDEQAIDRATHHAMVPNPPEGAKYNVPWDVDDPMVRVFDQNGVMALWAPLFPLKDMGSLESELESIVTQYMPSGNSQVQDANAAHKANLRLYVQKLRQGAGEHYDLQNRPYDQEGFNVVRIANPMMTRPVANQVMTRISNPFGVQDPKDLKTSWNDVKNDVFEPKGRTGYSVKFVSFEYLQRGGINADGAGGTASNVIPSDPETDADIQFIKH